MRFVVTRTSSFKKLLRDVGVDFPDGEKKCTVYLWKSTRAGKGRGGDFLQRIAEPPHFVKVCAASAARCGCVHRDWRVTGERKPRFHPLCIGGCVVQGDTYAM